MVWLQRKYASKIKHWDWKNKTYQHAANLNYLTDNGKKWLCIKIDVWKKKVWLFLISQQLKSKSQKL